MKNLLSQAISLLAIIYFLGASYYGYKFYYEDTKESSSFTQWYYFGELKSGAKAMIWPYYFFTGNHESKAIDEESFECYRQSLNYRKMAVDAWKLVDKKYDDTGIIYTVDEDDPQNQLSLKYYKMALDQAYRVLPNSLNIIDESLEQYKAKFIKGLELFIQGYETNDDKLANEGSLLMDSFGDFHSRLYDRLNH